MKGLKLSSPSGFLAAGATAACDDGAAPSAGADELIWRASSTGIKGLSKKAFGTLTGSVLAVLGLVGVEGLHVVVQLLLSGLLKPDLW